MAYTPASASDLKAAFPAFAAVAEDTIDFWLERARRIVDESWTEGDYSYGQMLLACHYMTLNGLGTGTDAQVNAEGLGDFKAVRSGQFSFQRADSSNAANGEIASTSYGRQWASLARSNRGGVRITGTGSIPDDSPYPGPFYSSGG